MGSKFRPYLPAVLLASIMSSALQVVALLALMALFTPRAADAHGRLINPASRGSAFRFGFKNPSDWNDNAGVCGGHSNQKNHGGKCGMCGDKIQGPFDHEAGGKFANGIITKTYSKGQKIDVKLDLTANHGGWFEFQICGPMKDKLTKITDDCLKTLNILGVDGKDLAVGTTRFTMPEKRKGKWSLSVQLPADLTCDHCVFRWFWYPSKDWGCDPDGTCSTGHGPQEKHIHCADIAIHE